MMSNNGQCIKQVYNFKYTGTQQTIYSTLLDAMRLKVPELIRHFDDNLRPKASNLRRIQYRFGTEAPKSVEFATNSISIRN